MLERIASNMNSARYSNFHLYKKNKIENTDLPTILEINNLIKKFEPDPEIKAIPFPENYFLDGLIVEESKRDVLQFWVYDHSSGNPILVEGSPFKSINKASQSINCVRPSASTYVNTGKLLKKRYSFHTQPIHI